MKFESNDNPWCVDNLNVFLYFCCPECDVKNSSKEFFVKHALEEHPKFKENYEKNFIKIEYDDDNLDNGNRFHEILENKSSSKRKRKQRHTKLKQNDERNNSHDGPEIIEAYNSELNNDETPEEELNSYIKEDIVKCESKPSFNENSSNQFIKDELNDENGNNDEQQDDYVVHKGLNQSTLKEIKSLKRHQCELCDKYFRVPSLLLEHVKIHHELTKDYNCNYCGKSYALEKYLKCHIEKVHERKKLEEHQCNQCEKTFDFAKYLRNHIKTVHEGKKQEYKRVVCGQCGKTMTANNIKHHVQTVHEGLRKFKCDQCIDKFFTNKQALNKHIEAIHEGHRNYFKCDQCDKTFSQQSYIKLHVQYVHEGLKLFKCESCGKSFGKKQSLKLHIRNVHEGHKDFTCDSCGKAFQQPSYLKHHISTVHEGSRNFNCEFCGKTFGYKEGFKNHIRTVHQGIRYQCDNCEKSFTQLPNLKKHLQIVHGLQYEAKSIIT